ncbi:MAG: hypothetical protein AUG51_03790 [Acidobacteria bacterium 13_1_20CM_3_53_8]|nr:MAG: hypothetical protein AUG51_03790 [Acidobacteria bacterium 13_1_20CM_3_53_8]
MLLALLQISRSVGAAQTGEYNAIVKLVENFYHVKHKGLPLLARAGMRIARPNGVKSFKLATFENQDFSAAGQSDFYAAMKMTLNAEWRPLLQIRSRQDGQQTYVFTREAGDQFNVLVVTIERRDATVLQVEVAPQALIRWMQNPEQMSRSLIDEATNSSEP